MTTPVIETNELSKDFGSILAVDNLSLSIPKGSVFGLLGPNGAGKITIIRLLLGLITPTSRRFSLFGVEINGSIESALRRIGATMETPYFHSPSSIKSSTKKRSVSHPGLLGVWSIISDVTTSRG